MRALLMSCVSVLGCIVNCIHALSPNRLLSKPIQRSKIEFLFAHPVSHALSLTRSLTHSQEYTFCASILISPCICIRAVYTQEEDATFYPLSLSLRWPIPGSSHSHSHCRNNIVFCAFVSAFSS